MKIEELQELCEKNLDYIMKAIEMISKNPEIDLTDEDFELQHESIATSYTKHLYTLVHLMLGGQRKQLLLMLHVKCLSIESDGPKLMFDYNFQKRADRRDVNQLPIPVFIADAISIYIDFVRPQLLKTETTESLWLNKFGDPLISQTSPKWLHKVISHYCQQENKPQLRIGSAELRRILPTTLITLLDSNSLNPDDWGGNEKLRELVLGGLAMLMSTSVAMLIKYYNRRISDSMNRLFLQNMNKSIFKTETELLTSKTSKITADANSLRN